MSNNKRSGRTDLCAHQITAETLVLGGQRFTREDLQRQTPPLLVQLQPGQPPAPTVPPSGVDDKLLELQTALEKTRVSIEQTRTVQLERTAVKRKGHYYIAGRRVNASDLKGDGRRYFAVANYCSVQEAMQRLAEEIDMLHGVAKDSSGEISTSSTSSN